MKKKLVAHKLNQFFATAICGNDILSSILYVSGIAIAFAGVYAPLVLLAIAFVLLLYKSVYTEVVEALPVNGGAYNCLLNGTQKVVAAIAGITTFLSYVATAVISAKIAIEYLNTLFPIPVLLSTIILLFGFALLVVVGIRDSARVAGIIFVLHIVSLITIVVLGYLHFRTGTSVFVQNFFDTQTLIANHGGLAHALYLAFAASLLGVSGFESSANFVEEQAPGVFRKTLRNMLLGITIFNPLVALVVLNALPLASIASAQNFLLAQVALTLGGPLLQTIIVIDAFLVLSGAVLTSYIGVSGLLYRMASDSCLPNTLTKRNRRGSYPRIVAVFFLLCSSILLLTRGNLLSLAGVYTIAFLGVMTLFALGNLILKFTRKELKRTYRAPIVAVLLSIVATAIGIVGNITIDSNNLLYFALYFIPAVMLIVFLLYQDYILRFALRITRHIPPLHRYFLDHFEDITEGKFVVFINHVDKLYSILRYINRNETGRNIYLVHCKSSRKRGHGPSCMEIKEAIDYLQRAGVFPHLHITFLCKHKAFTPKTIQEVSKELHIRTNRILMGSIHYFHPFDYTDLHGARIIF